MSTSSLMLSEIYTLLKEERDFDSISRRLRSQSHLS